mmetsp:Transcript_39179/g.43745  ORF Transcript_39179/g.43745 Transcript_39179/m.43745 type:complete len:214 (-) Transcript_39179:103-744(-)
MRQHTPVVFDHHAPVHEFDPFDLVVPQVLRQQCGNHDPAIEGQVFRHPGGWGSVRIVLVVVGGGQGVSPCCFFEGGQVDTGSFWFFWGGTVTIAGGCSSCFGFIMGGGGRGVFVFVILILGGREITTTLASTLTTTPCLQLGQRIAACLCFLFPDCFLPDRIGGRYFRVLFLPRAPLGRPRLGRTLPHLRQINDRTLRLSLFFALFLLLRRRC